MIEIKNLGVGTTVNVEGSKEELLEELAKLIFSLRFQADFDEEQILKAVKSGLSDSNKDKNPFSLNIDEFEKEDGSLDVEGLVQTLTEGICKEVIKGLKSKEKEDK